jgi:hypothetical protein
MWLQALLVALLSLSLVLCTETSIKDGDTVVGELGAGEEKMYKWEVTELCDGGSCEAAFFLTTFTDWDPPKMYVRKGVRPVKNDPQAMKCDSWGSWGVLIREEELKSTGVYYVLVTCSS